MEHVVRNPCEMIHHMNQSAEGTTEKLCRTFSTLIVNLVMDAGVTCFALHHLPGNCRPFRTFFQNLRNSELQKLRILRFLISEILNFYNSGAALGIAAASFAKLGLQTSDYGLRFFLSGAVMKRAKI